MAKQKAIQLESTELAWICDQVALVQKSGIPLPEGIELLADSSDLPRLTQVLRALAIEMRGLVPLSEAMEKLNSFPAYLVQMSRIGEMSGNLDHVMSNLAEFYRRDALLRRKVRNSLIYPLVLMAMMLAIIILLIVRVLPVFSEILASFGGEMPRFSQGLLLFGNIISRHAFWLFPVVFILIAALYLWLKRSVQGQRLIDKAKLKLPVFGPLYRRIYASRFSISLSYLLRSAIDFDTSLSMTEAIMDNTIVVSRIAACRQKIARGADTFTALQETELFPRLFIRMLSLGNRTGDLDAVLQKIASSYEQEVDSRLTRLTSIVEPLLVIILSLIVGAILLTVMLPLVEIMTSIG